MSLAFFAQTRNAAAQGANLYFDTSATAGYQYVFSGTSPWDTAVTADWAPSGGASLTTWVTDDIANFSTPASGSGIQTLLIGSGSTVQTEGVAVISSIGTLVVNGGTLQIDPTAVSAFNESAANGNITINSAVILNGTAASTYFGTGNANSSVNAGSAVTINGNISQGSNTTGFRVTGGITLNGSNSFTGGIQLNYQSTNPSAGAVTIGQPAALGSGALCLGGGSNAVQAGTLNLNFSTSGTVSNAIGFYTNTAAEANFGIQSSGAAVTINGPINANMTPFLGGNTQELANLYLSGTSVASNTIASVISDSANSSSSLPTVSAYITSVIKAGNGSWTLSGSNVYSGTTTINGGALIVGSNDTPGATETFSSLSMSGSTIKVNSTAGLVVGDYLQGYEVTEGSLYITAITSSTTVTLSGTDVNQNNVTQVRECFYGEGALGNAGSSVLLSATGNSSPSLLIGGAFTEAHNITVASQATSGAYTIGATNTSGTAAYTGNVTLNEPVTLQAAPGGTTDFKTGTWTTNNNALTIGSAGNTGTVKIDNTISTTGAVTVNYGTLIVSGSIAGTASVGLNASTLEVDGSLNTSATISRVRRRHCCRPLPSEPDVRVSPHPAQAKAKPRQSGAGVTTV